MITTTEFLAHLNAGRRVQAGSPMHLKMCELSEEAMRITAQINSGYHTTAELQQLFAQLTGQPLNDTFRLFPPFYTDCGRNIRLGKGVFINACCNFQDQGGITIGDGSLIGHKIVLATLNHGATADDRGTLYPAPIVIGCNVWIGAAATVLPGVTIGDHAIVAAGAVVSHDVAANTVVAGVPARVIKHL